MPVVIQVERPLSGGRLGPVLAEGQVSALVVPVPYRRTARLLFPDHAVQRIVLIDESIL